MFSKRCQRFDKDQSEVEVREKQNTCPYAAEERS